MIKSRPSISAPKKTRGAKEMADSDKIPQVDPTEIEILIEKFEQNKLEERERRLIVALLRTFLIPMIFAIEKHFIRNQPPIFTQCCQAVFTFAKSSLRLDSNFTLTGISSQVFPSRMRPARFLFTPPHCLKKKGTFAAWH